MSINKKIICVIASLFLLFVLSTPYVDIAHALSKSPNIESSSTPEMRKSGRILAPSTPTKIKTPQIQPILAPIQLAAPVISTPIISPNLIQNNSVESTSSVGLPLNWAKGGYGTNTRVLSYPVSGYTGSSAIKAEITAYTNGDAKWYFSDVPVTPGQTYNFSDYYISNIPTVLDVQFKMSDGTFTYIDIATLPASSVFKNATAQFVAPTNAISATVFHLIQQVGYLTTDEFSLTYTTTQSTTTPATTTPPVNPPATTTPPVNPPATTTPDITNLILNPNFEQAGSNGLPANWNQGGWGVSTSTFSYPAVSGDGSKAARIDITKYTSGDKKWYFQPIAVSPGTYTYSDSYSSSAKSTITVQFQNKDGTFTYKDIATLPAGATYKDATIDFDVSSSVKNVTVFHLINGVGYLAIDNVVLKSKSISTTPTPTAKGIFTTGAVTFRFDDGWLTQYTNAIPKLNSSGFKATFFITTQQLADNGYSGFMTKSNLTSIFKQGYEIGSHTRTHPYLSTLSQTQQQNEIQGSKQDLIAMNLGNVPSFAYPYGDYSQTTIDVIKNSGYTNANSSIDGFVTPSSDVYQLESQVVTTSVNISQIKSWIDEAAANKKWLIIELHEVSTSGDMYRISPSNFNAMVDYVTQKKIPVVTIQQGMQSM